MGDEIDGGNDIDSSTENTALIVREESADGPSIKRLRRPSHQPILSVTSSANEPVPKVRSGTAIINLLCAVLFIAASANGFATVPLTRIVEDVVCRQYYGQEQSLEEPIDEKLCKLEAIQSEVAFLFAITGMCEALVGFLAAFPWGIVADRYASHFCQLRGVVPPKVDLRIRIGRRPVFSTALVGMALSVLFTMMVLWFPNVFPTKFIALDSAFLLIGGGNAVVLGILLSMIYDVVPDDKRFLQISFAFALRSTI